MSSQSNSTESLNSLASPLLIPITDDVCNFNRAVGKKSNNSEELLTLEALTASPNLLPSQASSSHWTTPYSQWSIPDENFNIAGTKNISQPPLPLADALTNHNFIFGANCAQLQDFINVPKLSEIYSAKNMIGLEAELAVAKISDFITNNKTAVVDTTNRYSARKDTNKTTELVDTNEFNIPNPLLPTPPKSIWTSKAEEMTPHNSEIDLMTFPETNFFHETPIRSRNRNSDVEALGTERVPLQLQPETIEFGKLNFGSSLSNIFKPKSSLSKNTLPRNDDNSPITTKTPNQSTQSHQVQRNPSSTSSMRSSGSTVTSGFSRISIVSGIGSTCGTSASSSRSTFTEKQQTTDSTKPQYAAVVIQGRGMSGVPVWLKSLRLHKYTWVFVDMSYERMLGITEEYLEVLGITKGARNKLALSIVKLNERFQTMDSIENGLLNGTCVTASALDELTTVVQTPMKPADPFDERDVASKFLRVVNLGKHFFCILFSCTLYIIR